MASWFAEMVAMRANAGDDADRHDLSPGNSRCDENVDGVGLLWTLKVDGPA